ncbi:MAG: SRPBCC domain-containing protein, partial [Sneathiella sp.]
MSGEELINASKATVWEALNDPDILKQAIPGCESVEREGEDGFTATVKVKVGPVKA